MIENWYGGLIRRVMRGQAYHDSMQKDYMEIMGIQPTYYVLDVYHDNKIKSDLSGLIE